MARRRLARTTNVFHNHPNRDQFVNLVNILLKAIYLQRAVVFHNASFYAEPINCKDPIDQYGANFGSFHNAVAAANLGDLDVHTNPLMAEFVSFCNTVLLDARYKKFIDLIHGDFRCQPVVAANLSNPPFQDNFNHFKLFRAFQETLFHLNPRVNNRADVNHVQDRVLQKLNSYGMNIAPYQGYLIANNMDQVNRYTLALNQCRDLHLQIVQPQLIFDQVAETLHFV